jgi:predicted aspartyl protease
MDMSRWPARITRSAGEALERETALREKIASQSLGKVASIRVATRQDPFGRILVPVRINNKGPFYFVVNSGASTIAISDQAVRRLKVPLNKERQIVVHGVRGTSTVPALRNLSITLGGLPIPAAAVPVLTHGLEGADGMLGLTATGRSHIQLDVCQHHMVVSTGGLPTPPAPGSTSLPLDTAHAKLLVIDTHVQGMIVKTIIDTGAQSTIGNVALQLALGGSGDAFGVAGPIIGLAAQDPAEVFHPLHPVGIGDLRIIGARICYSQAPLFEKVGLGNTPAMLLGMNVLSKLGHLSFDFTTRTVLFGLNTSKSAAKSRQA